MGNGIIRKKRGNLNGFSEKVRMSDSIYITEKRFNSKVNKFVQNNSEPSTETIPIKHFTDRIHYLTGPLLYDNLKRGFKLKDLLQKSHYINIMENLELIKGLSFNISNYLNRMELSGILTKDLAITLKRSIQAIDTAFVKRISSIDLSNNRINSRTLIIIKKLVCIYHLIKYLKEEGAFEDGKWWKPLTNEKYGEILSQKIEEKCEAILENYDKSDNSKDSSDLGDKVEILPSEDTIIQNIKAAEILQQQIIAKNQRISNKIMIIEKDLDKIEEELNSGTLETSRNGIGNDSDLMAMSIRKDFIEEKINIESHIKECSSEIKELTNKLRVVFGRSKPTKHISNSKINKKLTNTPPPSEEMENDVKLMNMVKEYLEITFENILSEI